MDRPIYFKVAILNGNKTVLLLKYTLQEKGKLNVERAQLMGRHCHVQGIPMYLGI